MGESAHHVELVTRIVHWIQTQHAGNDGLSILADTVSFPSTRRPPLVGGFVPDVLALTAPSSFLILGEAKTFADVFSTRTNGQLRAYLRYLSTQHDATFVMAMPLAALGAARSLVRRIQREMGARHVRTMFLCG
jgi:hypothetical protein